MRRGNIARRGRGIFPKHMFRHMLKPTAAAVEQLARRGWLFVFELRAPVPEALQGRPVQLAIFPLIQISTPPTVQMRPPERFQFPKRFPAVILGTITLLLHRICRGEKIAPGEPQTSVQRPDAVSVRALHVGQGLTDVGDQFQGRRSSRRLMGWPCVMRSITSLR